MKFNERLYRRYPSVRLIDSTGKQVGIVSSREALYRARQEGLDLVIVNTSENIPVCKILDYGKYQYDLDKKRKGEKLKKLDLKEINLRYSVGKADLDRHVKHASEWIKEGHPVRIKLRLIGRERAHSDIAKQVMQGIVDSLKDLANLDGPIKQHENSIEIILKRK